MPVAEISETNPLNITRSIGGNRWTWRCEDERRVLALQQRLQVPEILARVLAGRGGTLENATDLLNPTLKNLLPDPSHLLDMDKAASRLADAVEKGEQVAVFGDYDVDGATSSALLARFLRALGQEPVIYIPDRMTEGYGPNVLAMQSLAKQARLIITVDCGTLSFEPIEAVVAAGAEVIVIDHHQGEPRLPEAVAVVNPNRVDETSECRYLAAVGVTFLLLVAVTRALRRRGYFSEIPEPDLRQWLDIVALGTVCDVVPLQGVNRAFVAQGLRVMANRGNTGLAALMQVARMDELPGTYHAGFVLGPRINAGGRVGKSDYGSLLLSTESPEEAARLAAELDIYNAERKAIETMVQDEVMEQAARQENLPVMCLAGEGWHPGVIGIVAGRVKEQYDRPAAVIALEKGIGKASARSVPGVDMGAAVIAARLEGLLEAGGGHAMAAGFTVKEEKIPALLEFFCARMGQGVADYAESKALKLDGILSPGGVTPELAEALEAAGPYGMAYPQPVFALKDCRVVQADVVGSAHVRTILTDPHGKGRCKAVAFRAADSELGHALLNSRGKLLHVAGTIRSNHWNGRTTAELHIVDVAQG